jgi:hypothetical protein
MALWLPNYVYVYAFLEIMPIAGLRNTYYFDVYHFFCPLQKELAQLIHEGIGFALGLDPTLKGDTEYSFLVGLESFVGRLPRDEARATYVF